MKQSKLRANYVTNGGTFKFSYTIQLLLINHLKQQFVVESFMPDEANEPVCRYQLPSRQLNGWLYFGRWCGFVFAKNELRWSMQSTIDFDMSVKAMIMGYLEARQRQLASSCIPTKASPIC